MLTVHCGRSARLVQLPSRQSPAAVRRGRLRSSRPSPVRGVFPAGARLRPVNRPQYAPAACHRGQRLAVRDSACHAAGRPVRGPGPSRPGGDASRVQAGVGTRCRPPGVSPLALRRRVDKTLARYAERASGHPAPRRDQKETAIAQGDTSISTLPATGGNLTARSGTGGDYKVFIGGEHQHVMPIAQLDCPQWTSVHGSVHENTRPPAVPGTHDARPVSQHGTRHASRRRASGCYGNRQLLGSRPRTPRERCRAFLARADVELRHDCVGADSP
jgi:hypothetical protein